MVGWSVVLKESHSLSFTVPLVFIRCHSLYLQTIIEKSSYFSKGNILIATCQSKEENYQLDLYFIDTVEVIVFKAN